MLSLDNFFMVKQFFRCRRRPSSRQLLIDGITMRFIKSVRALTNFSKSRKAHVAETASEKWRKLARNYLQNWRKLIRNCLQNWRKLIRNCLRKERKVNKIFLPNTGENLRDIFSQNQRKLEKYFSPKTGESFRAFSSKSQRNFEIFFSQNLIKLWKIFTLNIGESGHQKAEGGIPPSFPRSRRRCDSHKTLKTIHDSSTLFDWISDFYMRFK